MPKTSEQMLEEHYRYVRTLPIFELTMLMEEFPFATIAGDEGQGWSIYTITSGTFTIEPGEGKVVEFINKRREARHGTNLHI